MCYLRIEFKRSLLLDGYVCYLIIEFITSKERKNNQCPWSYINTRHRDIAATTYIDKNSSRTTRKLATQVLLMALIKHIGQAMCLLALVVMTTTSLPSLVEGRIMGTFLSSTFLLIFLYTFGC